MIFSNQLMLDFPEIKCITAQSNKLRVFAFVSYDQWAVVADGG